MEVCELNRKVKIICQLYIPNIENEKLIFYQEPIEVHKKFINENYCTILKYVEKIKKRRS